MATAPKFNRSILVTGGAGFVGTNLLLDLVPRYPDRLFVNLDKLTYAGNLENLREIETVANCRFVRGDICDEKLVDGLFGEHGFDGVIHLAAESHVDRSILAPRDFLQTNVVGTFTLLEVVRKHRRPDRPIRFVHVSSDEVYGSVAPPGRFHEHSAYNPSSPYSAAKASSDHFVRAHHRTYGLDTIVVNCSNNYGPYQFPEKLIPLTIRCGIESQPIPVYGDGGNMRDWLYVGDHVAALEQIFERGHSGASYNLGGGSGSTNLEVVRLVCRLLDEFAGSGPHERLIRFVEDRPGHDYRYATDSSLAAAELGWKPQQALSDGLRLTVQWYLNHPEWVRRCTDGSYREYYQKWYSGRLEGAKAK